MMSLDPILYVSILVPTLVGLWLHRRLGPNRGTALFVIGGFVLGTIAGIAISHGLESRRRDREFDERFDRALSQLACRNSTGARTAHLAEAGMNVIVMNDVAVLSSRRPRLAAVRLVDERSKLIVELPLDGTTMSTVRDERIVNAREAVIVIGTSVYRAPLRADVTCARK